MRLCYIANPNSIHTHRWLQYFVERGHEVHLIALNPIRRSPPPDVVLYDLTARINVRKFRFLAWGLAVRQLAHQIQPDLVHAHQVSGAGWLGAAANYHPLVITAWGSDLLVGPRRFWSQRQLARWVLRQADYVTCVSESLAQVARDLGADPRRLEVAPWGVDLDVFYPSPDVNTLRAEYDYGQGPLVMSLRAIRPVYNPLDIARAIPSVLNQVPEAQFIIRTYAYDPDLLARFQAIVEQHRATASVHYVGEQADDQAIAGLNRIVDVAVSVPSSDGTPLSVLEAMACGAVLVLSDIPSLREWVQDQREGLLVPVGDVEAISAAIVRLLKDATLRHRLRASGLELIRQRADRQVWMARAEEMYRQLVT